ncbi:hypothetical protein GCM10028817_39010 [Spirosoma pomorum]
MYGIKKAMEKIRHYYDKLKETHPEQWSAFNAELARMNEIDHFKRNVLNVEPKELCKKRLNVMLLVVSSIPGIDIESIFHAGGIPVPSIIKDTISPQTTESVLP